MGNRRVALAFIFFSRKDTLSEFTFEWKFCGIQKFANCKSDQTGVACRGAKKGSNFKHKKVEDGRLDFSAKNLFEFSSLLKTLATTVKKQALLICSRYRRWSWRLMVKKNCSFLSQQEGFFSPPPFFF